MEFERLLRPQPFQIRSSTVHFDPDRQMHTTSNPCKNTTYTKSSMTPRLEDDMTQCDPFCLAYPLFSSETDLPFMEGRYAEAYSQRESHDCDEIIPGFESSLALHGIFQPHLSLEHVDKAFDNCHLKPYGMHPEEDTTLVNEFSIYYQNYSETLEDELAFYTAVPELCSPSSLVPKTVDEGETDSGIFLAGTPCSFSLQDDHPVADKPYARLIFEALMQAPGHRMMLREIYEWFIHNTSKPQDSGSNGWQNSIRHNLSMNKAFENDKSGQTGRGNSKKANSVWSLTSDAIAHGVQSTTRYRKHVPSKRCLKSRANATARQKPGAKGGRANKRAVLPRIQGEDGPSSIPDLLSGCISAQHSIASGINPSEHSVTTAFEPATPGAIHDTVYTLPCGSDSGDLPVLKQEDIFVDDTVLLDDLCYQACHGELLKVDENAFTLGSIFM